MLKVHESTHNKVSLYQSKKDKNEAQLMSLIGKYNAEMKAENDRLGRMSDCAVVPKPAVVLENGVCTLTKGSGGDMF